MSPSKVTDTSAQPADLLPPGAAFEVDGTLLALELVALHGDETNPQRACLLKHCACYCRLLPWAGQSRQHDARPALLHVHRHCPDIERARGKTSLHRVGDELGAEIVQVRLEEHDVGLVSPRLRTPEDNTYEVRSVGELLSPCAVADALERERRQQAPRVCHRGENRGAGRRDELTGSLDPDEWCADEERERRWSGDGQNPVSSAHQAAGIWQRRAGDAFDLQLVEERHDAAYVDQRIHAAELVEMHLVRLDAVDAPFDLGEPLKGTQ